MSSISASALGALPRDQVRIVDLRDAGDYRGARIPGSISSDRERIARAVLGHAQVVLVDSDGRGESRAVHALLHAAGRSVWVLDGGILEWESRGQPIERGIQLPIDLSPRALRFFPASCFDEDPVRDTLFAQMSGGQLDALGEEPVFGDRARTVHRVLVTPHHDPAFVVRAVRHGDDASLHIVTAEGAYSPRALAQDAWGSIDKSAAALRDSPPLLWGRDGRDGRDLCIEMRTPDGYHAIRRWAESAEPEVERHASALLVLAGLGRLIG